MTEREQRIEFRKKRSKEIMDKKLPYISLEMAVWIADYQIQHKYYEFPEKDLKPIEEIAKANKNDIIYSCISDPGNKRMITNIGKKAEACKELASLIGKDNYERLNCRDYRLAKFWCEYVANVAWDAKTEEEIDKSEEERNWHTGSFHGDNDRAAKGRILTYKKYKEWYPDFEYYDDEEYYRIIDNVRVEIW